MDNKLSYSRPIVNTFEELIREHQKVLQWVGTNKKVLETACHTGYISAWLKKQGCTVTGAEIYAPALAQAAPFLHRSILGNVETKEVWNQISSEKYDAVLYMHILEHLVSPDELLRKTKDILNPGGIVIICLPNISNWENRWAQFKGNFDYTETGIMDKTHLRFFNFYTAKKLIGDTGFSIDEYCGDSWKVRFKIIPDTKLTRWTNNMYSSLMYKLASRNFTDKITMFKVTVKNS